MQARFLHVCCFGSFLVGIKQGANAGGGVHVAERQAGIRGSEWGAKSVALQLARCHVGGDYHFRLLTLPPSGETS